MLITMFIVVVSVGCPVMVLEPVVVAVWVKMGEVGVRVMVPLPGLNANMLSSSEDVSIDDELDDDSESLIRPR